MGQRECFGILDKVFPIKDKGLREIAPECSRCPERFACLKESLATREGIEMRAEILEKAPVSGLMGRLRRWSQKKELSRMAQEDRDRKR